jgi:hypothetical protein
MSGGLGKSRTRAPGRTRTRSESVPRRLLRARGRGEGELRVQSAGMGRGAGPGSGTGERGPSSPMKSRITPANFAGPERSRASSLKRPPNGPEKSCEAQAAAPRLNPPHFLSSSRRSLIQQSIAGKFTRHILKLLTTTTIPLSQESAGKILDDCSPLLPPATIHCPFPIT